MPVKYSDVLVADSIASRLVCEGKVCLSQAHSDDLPRTAAVGRDVLAKLAVLPDAPTEIREDTSAMAHLTAPQRDQKTVYVPSQGYPRVLTMTDDQLRLELLSGAGVAGCSGPNSFNTYEGVVRYLTAYYFNGELAELASEPLLWNSSKLRADIDEAWQQFRGQSAQEQLNRVARARQMLLTCQDSERVLDVLKASR